MSFFEGGIQEHETLNQGDLSGNMREFAEHRDSHLLLSSLPGVVPESSSEYFEAVFHNIFRYVFRGSKR